MRLSLGDALVAIPAVTYVQSEASNMSVCWTLRIAVTACICWFNSQPEI